MATNNLRHRPYIHCIYPCAKDRTLRNTTLEITWVRETSINANPWLFICEIGVEPFLEGAANTLYNKELVTFWLSLRRNIAWSTMSKAKERLRDAKITHCPPSTVLTMSLLYCTKAVSVE